jgi:hypothetical protein
MFAKAPLLLTNTSTSVMNRMCCAHWPPALQRVNTLTIKVNIAAHWC